MQAAVDRCPSGGCVLLLPGAHDGPLVLSADQEVHVFGRGQATLWASDGHVLTSSAVTATVDGLFVRRELGGDEHGCGVRIDGGELRVQSCDIVCAQWVCVRIAGGSDPTLTSCRCARGCIDKGMSY